MEDNLKNDLNSVAGEVIHTVLMKNRDYGSAFTDLLNEFGGIVYYLHAYEKVLRIKGLLRLEDNVYTHVNESIEDSVKDLIGYSLLYLIELQKPKEDVSHEH